MFDAISFFCSSGVGGMVPNPRISGPVNTFPHMTKSAKNAPTPAIKPATIQLSGAPPTTTVCTAHGRPRLFPLSGDPQFRHRQQIEHALEALALESALLAHALPPGAGLSPPFLVPS